MKKNDEIYNEMINKLVNIEDKFQEIKSIARVLSLWVKENAYEIIPIMNILNDRIQNMAEIIEK